MYVTLAWALPILKPASHVPIYIISFVDYRIYRLGSQVADMPVKHDSAHARREFHFLFHLEAFCAKFPSTGEEFVDPKIFGLIWRVPTAGKTWSVRIQFIHIHFEMLLI